MAGGNFGALLHLSELVIIGGAALGAMVIMAPKKVLLDFGQRRDQRRSKARPTTARLTKSCLWRFTNCSCSGRRNGLIALEEHLTNPRDQRHLPALSQPC